MSEARSSTARAISELTSRTTGASSEASAMSAWSTGSSPPLSCTRSATTASRREVWPSSVWISSGLASAGRISCRVRMRRSSIAKTFDGSAIATTRRPSASMRTGTAW